MNHPDLEDAMTLCRNCRDLLQTNERFSPHSADIEIPSQPAQNANRSPELVANNKGPSEYRSKLWSTTNPPQCYGFT